MISDRRLPSAVAAGPRSSKPGRRKKRRHAHHRRDSPHYPWSAATKALTTECLRRREDHGTPRPPWQHSTQIPIAG
jgi:hypothetical protein